MSSNTINSDDNKVIVALKAKVQKLEGREKRLEKEVHVLRAVCVALNDVFKDMRDVSDPCFIHVGKLPEVVDQVLNTSTMTLEQIREAIEQAKVKP